MTKKRILENEDVLRAINESIVERGVPPTVDELRAKLGIGSKRTILRYLKSLEESGQISRWPGARGIRLQKVPDVGSATQRVPLVGEVTAGALMIAEENLQGWVRLPDEMLANKNAKYFLLRIKGDSMNLAEVRGNRIEDGDLALVEQRASANRGEVIVGYVDGEATVKRFDKGDDFYILRPDSTNPKHEPIILSSDFQIQGIVTRVLKRGGFLLDEDV